MRYRCVRRPHNDRNMNAVITTLQLLGDGGSSLAALLAIQSLLNARLLRRPPPTACVHERVSVLIPARNEAGVIGGCLQSLLASTGIADLEILVLDDESTDGTADLVRTVAEADARLTLIAGMPLPVGWLGKPYACHQLAAHSTGSVLVFLDADVTVTPTGIARSVSLLREWGLDLVSPYPRQVYPMGKVALVQPLLQWSWLTLVPLRVAERSFRPSLAVANGQLLVCDAAVYQAVGGHAAVPGSVIEDIALLRSLLSAGKHGTVADGVELATCRMYDTWPALVDGYTKSLWAAGGSRLRSAGQVAFLLLCYLAPLVGIAAGAWWCVGGYAAAVINRLVTDRVSRAPSPPAYALLHPISVVLLSWLVVRSWRARSSGTITWKGRTL